MKNFILRNCCNLFIFVSLFVQLIGIFIILNKHEISIEILLIESIIMSALYFKVFYNNNVSNKKSINIIPLEIKIMSFLINVSGTLSMVYLYLILELLDLDIASIYLFFNLFIILYSVYKDLLLFS